MGPLRSCSRSIIGRRWNFFVLRLQDLSEPSVDRQELLYNASLLAHYAQVSTQPDVDVPAPANLERGLRPFCGGHDVAGRPADDGNGGAQCLLLAGFFEDQMRPRHNIRWYAELGRVSSPGRRSRAVVTQSPADRRHRGALRALAPAPRAAESRAAGPALLTDPAHATQAQYWIGRNLLLSNCAISRVAHRRIAGEGLRSHALLLDTSETDPRRHVS